MKLKRLLVLMVVLALSMVLVACGSDSGDVSDTTTPDSTTTTVSIGAIEPLTGAYGTLGTNMKAAMEVAVDIINNKHDLDWAIAQNEGLAGLDNAKVELIWGDCQSDASVASTEAAAVLEKGVTGILGAYASGLSAAVASQALEYNVPMVCGGSSSATLTDGVTYDFGAIFNRIAATDEMESIEF